MWDVEVRDLKYETEWSKIVKTWDLNVSQKTAIRKKDKIMEKRENEKNERCKKDVNTHDLKTWKLNKREI